MEANPYKSPEISPELSIPRTDATRRSFAFPLAFYGLAIVWGCRNVEYRHSSALDLLVPVALAVCVGLWALTDAKRRGHTVPMLARSWFILATGLVVPVYVIYSRGWRGVGWLVLHAVGWLALATVIMNVGGMWRYGDEW